MRIPGCVQNGGNTLLSLFDLISMVHPSEPGSSEPHLVPGEKETPTSSHKMGKLMGILTKKNGGVME